MSVVSSISRRLAAPRGHSFDAECTAVSPGSGTVLGTEGGLHPGVFPGEWRTQGDVARTRDTGMLLIEIRVLMGATWGSHSGRLLKSVFRALDRSPSCPALKMASPECGWMGMNIPFQVRE